jgi:hypothetical protein
MADKTTKNITATLLRGKTYYYKGTRFDKGEPVSISLSLAEEIEEINDEVTDKDGEIRQKPCFKVEYANSKAAPVTVGKKVTKRVRKELELGGDKSPAAPASIKKRVVK